MDTRFYNAEGLNIERLATDLENIYRAQGFQAQQLGTSDQKVVQLRKGGDFESLLGLQAALTITIQRTSGGILVTAGQQKWVDKAAVGFVGMAVPILWPLIFTAGAGALRQATLAGQVLSLVDQLVHQQQPGAQAGPAPAGQPTNPS